ncbi:hypothetical protein, partial [Vibrio azureus]|uniref:hypothetical protein n=1 Tax=Vibrio azureus TaxID=512649 RepID=UPI0005878C51
NGCLTQEVGSVTRSQRASGLNSQTLLTILNVEPLYLQIVAAPESSGHLAERSILRLLGYNHNMFFKLNMFAD